MYPKVGPPRIIINTIRESGGLEQVARMELDASGGELKSKSAHLHILYKDKPDILDSVRKLIGHTPKIEGEDGDTAMS